MLEINNQLSEFERFYEKLDYLKDSKFKNKYDDFFFDEYKPTLELLATSNIRYESDFTQENRDTIIRLNQRWTKYYIENDRERWKK